MQNTFTIEQNARFAMDRYREEARRHDLLQRARAGQPRRHPGAMLLRRAGSLRERFLMAIRQERDTTAQPSCQPGMAC